MPSPFPGMDPYLEGSLWTTVHFQLSAEIARQLAPRLRPKYLVLANERFVLTALDAEGVMVSEADMYPDAAVLQPRETEMAEGPRGGGTAVAAPPLRVATVMPRRVPHVTVEIRDVEHRRLVTAIEVLSPANKRGARREYLRKRQRLLLSSAHLMEIDLLRSGRRMPMRRPLPMVPYFVFLSRAEDRPFTDVWPIPLTERLPSVPVPLSAGDADLELDLQQALTAIYDTFSYDLAVDYTRPPTLPLSPEDAAWAGERVRAWRASRGIKVD
jgi:hypothetical protein